MIHRYAVAACLAAVLAQAPSLIAAEPAPRGAKAVLQLTVEIEGTASVSDQTIRSHKWSTKRRLTIEQELQAAAPQAVDPDQTLRGGAPSTSPAMDGAAFAAEMQKCGADSACQMRAAQRMAQAQAGAAGSQRGGSKRYQMWIIDRRTPEVAGTGRIEDKTDAVIMTSGPDEHSDCTLSGEFKMRRQFPDGLWDARLTVDTQTGQHRLYLPYWPRVEVERACTVTLGQKRSNRRDSEWESFMPSPTKTEGEAGAGMLFSGASDAGGSGRRLAHGEKGWLGSLGTLPRNVPKTAKVTLRWTVTMKD